MPTDLNLFRDIFPVFYLLVFVWAGFVLVTGGSAHHTWKETLLAALATAASAAGWITTWPGDKLNQYVLAPVADAFSYVWTQCAEHPFHTVAMAIILVFVVWRVRWRIVSGDDTGRDWLGELVDGLPARTGSRSDEPTSPHDSGEGGPPTEEMRLPPRRPQVGADF